MRRWNFIPTTKKKAFHFRGIMMENILDIIVDPTPEMLSSMNEGDIITIPKDQFGNPVYEAGTKKLQKFRVVFRIIEK